MKFFKCTLSLTLAVLIFISMTSVMIVGAKDVELADVGAWNTSYTSKLNGDPFNDITEIALAQEGKDADDLGLSGRWCALFASECASIAGQSTAIPYNGGVGDLYKAVISAGGYEVTTPKKGDLIFFYRTNRSGLGHVGFVTDSTHNVSGNIEYNGAKGEVYILKNTSEGFGNNFFFVRPAYTNTEHTCNMNVYYSYWKAHPHYYLYKCSICGKEVADYSQTKYIEDCSECNVGNASAGVDQKINELLSLFPDGSYFSKSGGACSHGAGGSCDNCYLPNILTRSDLAGLGYVKGVDYVGSWTCVSFTNFAFRYIYGEMFTSGNYYQVATGGFNKDFFSKAQKGDIIIFCNSSGSWLHRAVFIGDVTTTTASFYQANFGGTPKVKYGSWTYSNMNSYYGSGSYGIILRANNHDNVSGEHICNKNQYYSYWKDHPHYYIYKCTVCGKEITDYDKTGYVIDCSECRVGKTVVRSNKQVYDYGESVFLSWDKVPNATHYSFYIMKKDDSGEYKEQIDLIREYESTKYARNDLDVGEYMIEMYSYDRNHWEKGNTDWCHERAEDIFFEVTDTRPSPVASMEYNGNTYRVYDYYTSWSNAKQMCEDLGGNLVTITSQEEMNEIKNLLVDAELYGYWIGFNDVDKDGVWENVTGEDTEYNYWGENQPDCYENNEYCAVIQNENDLKWNDVPDDCESYPIGFICEIENTEPDHTHEYTQYSESSSPCSSEYTRLYTCWICGETYKETGYKTAEHKYEIIENIASTCSTEGQITYKCNLCGDSYTKTIEPNGDHIPSDEWTVLKMPTEATYGSACKLCTLCNTQLEYATIDINGNIVSTDDNPSTKPQPPIHDQPLEYDIDAYIADEHTGDVMFNWSAHSGAAYYNIRIFDNDLKEIVNENVEEPYYHWSPITAEKGMLSVASYDANGIMFAESSLVTYNICLVAMGDWWGEYGDVDCSGKVNIKDATLIQKYLSKLADIADVGLGAADVNSDEKINIKDATAIQKYLASISTDTRVGEFYHYAFTDYEITLET